MRREATRQLAKTTTMESSDKAMMAAKPLCHDENENDTHGDDDRITALYHHRRDAVDLVVLADGSGRGDDNDNDDELPIKPRVLSSGHTSRRRSSKTCKSTRNSLQKYYSKQRLSDCCRATIT